MLFYLCMMEGLYYFCYKSLKIYRFQLIRDKKLSEEEANGEHGAATASHGTTSAGHAPAAAAPSGTHGETPAAGGHGETPAGGHGESSAAAGHSVVPTASTHAAVTEPTAAAAHHNAKRAILMVSDNYVDKQEIDYNPMEITRSMQETQQQQRPIYTDFHWTLWCKSLATTMAVTAMQLLASGGQYSDNTTISESSHLMRRSEPAAEGGGASETESSFTDSMTLNENDFVYKTFLIFAGLILVINSLIKMLNTKISDIYGKIIIVSRILNAIILWSMCALPFAKLDAIVLLCTMVGSLVFQGKSI